jgi:predicted permease
VTGPTFLWVMLGATLYRAGWIPDWLVRSSSAFVFRVGLPIILFSGSARIDYREIGAAHYLLAAALATVIIVAAALVYARLRGFRGEAAAIFVQGAYRANLGVVGIALCAAAYGDEGLALAALPVAIITVLFNLIAVILLSRAYSLARSPLRWLVEILQNPMVVGIILGAAYSVAGFPLNIKVERGIAMFAAVLLPLALLGIGASLNLRVLRESGWLTLEATAWKLLVTPAVAVAVAIAMGVHSAELGVLFLLLASPVSAASYIMVAAAGGQAGVAANIVVLSTLLSIFTLTLGLATLQAGGWI